MRAALFLGLTCTSADWGRQGVSELSTGWSWGPMPTTTEKIRSHVTTSTRAAPPPRPAPSVRSIMCRACSREQGDCRMREECSQCEQCYPDQLPLLFFSGDDGQLHLHSATGPVFHVKGVTWWGSEGVFTVLEGLDKRPMEDLFEFIADEGFNAVRILLNHRSVLDNAGLDLQVVPKSECVCTVRLCTYFIYMWTCACDMCAFMRAYRRGW